MMIRDMFPGNRAAGNLSSRGGLTDGDRPVMGSITSRNPAAVKNEAAFLTRNQPVLFQPNSDYTWAWKKTISGPAASFRSLTQYYVNPEFWSVTG